MNNTDLEYFRLLNLVLEKGKVKQNRTGTPTRGVFGDQARFDLKEGFPLLTTKKVFFKAIVHELLWFLSGSTNIKYLVDNDVHIWDEWAWKKNIADKGLSGITLKNFIIRLKEDDRFAQKYGELGEGTYGGMWRAFPTGFEDSVEMEYVDQISKVINTLKTNPDDRRLIVSSWHPYWSERAALAPCHCLFQFHTEELTVVERWKMNRKMIACYTDEAKSDFCDHIGIPKRRLNCQLYQRSCDLFLGVPFNIASYALLTHMVAQVVNMIPGDFIHTFGDLHIYENHLKQVKEQLNRIPKELPTLCLNQNIDDIFKFKYEDIQIHGYDPHPAIKGEVAI